MPRSRAARILRRAALALGVAAAACARAEPPRPPDVVVIVLDTLRADHLGLHGYPRETAPFLAEVAARGAVFARAWSSSSWTPPATASIFTGLYPTGHGLVRGFGIDARVAAAIEEGRPEALAFTPLPADVPTLPERMRAAGYATRAVATNPHVARALGFDRGFDDFLERTNESAETIVEWLIRRAPEIRGSGKPYLLYVHLNDVHAPYDPRSPWYEPADDERADAVARYDSEIAYVDAQLRRLAEAFEWGPSTLLVIASDHGEELGDHGAFGHEDSLHAELNRALLVIAGPGVAPGVVDANVSLVDLAPTVLDLAGAPLSESDARDGLSLRPLLERESRESAERALAARPLFAHRRCSGARRVLDPADAAAAPPMAAGDDLWSVVKGSWRLIEDPAAGTRRLYDVARDPLERADLAAQRPERAAELASALAAFRARGIRAPDAPAPARVDRALVEDLRDLGYVGGEPEGGR